MGKLDEVLKSIQDLELSEKMLLVESIWDSIREEEIPELTDAEKQEIERRITALKRNPESAIPWQSVQTTARAMLR